MFSGDTNFACAKLKRVYTFWWPLKSCDSVPREFPLSPRLISFSQASRSKVAIFSQFSLLFYDSELNYRRFAENSIEKWKSYKMGTATIMHIQLPKMRVTYNWDIICARIVVFFFTKWRFKYSCCYVAPSHNSKFVHKFSWL